MNVLKTHKLLLLVTLGVALYAIPLIAQQRADRAQQNAIAEFRRRRAMENRGWTRPRELGLRHFMTHTVQPAYPEEAVQAGAQGQVIAAVRFNEYGQLSMIRILQAPHPRLAQAVREAVRQWRMRRLVLADRTPVAHEGELRFNFIIEDGVGRVETPSPAEMLEESPQFRAFKNRWTTENDETDLPQ